jgi:hypothetical protein
MRTIFPIGFFAIVSIAMTACNSASRGGEPTSMPPTSNETRSNLYQPLGPKDSWTYSCRDIKGGGENGNRPFTIRNSVVGQTTIGKTSVYEFALAIPQVPSKPLRVKTVIQLLANDRLGNVRIYGFLIHGKLHPIPPALFVTANPPGESHKAFDYHGANGKTIDRIFFGLEQSNVTKFGVFEVAPYFEDASRHDYGYAKGWGIVEEDHGPNYEVDCLITNRSLH